MGVELPVSDAEMIASCEAELKALRKTSQDAEQLSAARFRYAWALVHSARKADIDAGLKLARTMLREGEGHARDVGYLEAVALYRMGKYLDARRACDTILEATPTCSQARALKKEVEDQIVTDGLVGVGIGAAVVGVAGAVIASLVMGSSRRS